jgi:Flp pilus assembly pilin Flp
MGHEKMTSRIRNGQSFIEYTMLIIIVSAALIAMTTYIMRSMNARLKQEQGELSYYKAEK